MDVFQVFYNWVAFPQIVTIFKGLLSAVFFYAYKMLNDSYISPNFKVVVYIEGMRLEVLYYSV